MGNGMGMENGECKWVMGNENEKWERSVGLGMYGEIVHGKGNMEMTLTNAIGNGKWE